MNFLIIGPPGSGKSTQAKLLAENLGIPHLSGGDLFYFLAQEDTPRGKEIKKKMESGGLLADQFVLKEVEKKLKEKQYQNGFVLDGTPRSLKQAQEFSPELDKVFYLKVSDEENIRRLTKRQRGDTDKPEVIRKRLEVYYQETEPMLAYYRQQKILEEIDGERPVEIILQDILARLNQ